MENWNPPVVYQLATERHREDIARGEAAQRQSARLGAQTIRARIAAALIVLAARLTPERTAIAPRGQAQHEQQATA